MGHRRSEIHVMELKPQIPSDREESRDSEVNRMEECSEEEAQLIRVLNA